MSGMRKLRTADDCDRFTAALLPVDEAFFASVTKAAATPHRERRERPSDERPEKPEKLELAEPVPPPPAASVIDTPEQAVAAALPSPEAAPGAPQEGEDRENRRRGRREERPARVTSPAEQAWGQPIGTPRLSPPPAPVVIETGEHAEPAAEKQEPTPAADMGDMPETEPD